MNDSILVEVQGQNGAYYKERGDLFIKEMNLYYILSL